MIEGDEKGVKGKRNQKNEKRRNALRSVRQDYRAVAISRESIIQSYQSVVERTANVMEIYHCDTEIEVTCEDIKEYKNLKSSSVCFKQSMPIQVKNVRKVMDSYQRFPASPLFSCISEISKNLAVVINDVKSSSHSGVTCAIKAIINALSNRPVDDREQLVVFHKECFDHSEQLLKRRAELHFHRACITAQLKKLVDISIDKYKFACFKALAKKIKDIEEIQYTSSRKTCQIKVMFMVKMRLTHSCCDIVKDVMSSSSVDDISSFVKRLFQPLYIDIARICKTINDMEDLNSDCSEEEDDEVVTDDDDCNCPGEHDEVVTNVEDSNCSGEGDDVVTGVDEEDMEIEWKSRVNRKLLTAKYSEDIEYKENRKDERYSENVANSNRKESNEEVHRISKLR